MTKPTADVLGTRLTAGTRRYRLTLADGPGAWVGTTWIGKVNWIDLATDTEPLDVVMTGEDDSTLVLTLAGDAWLLTRGRTEEAPRAVTAVEPIKQARRKRTGTDALADMLRLK